MNFVEYYEREESGEPAPTAPRRLDAELQFEAWMAMQSLGLLEGENHEVVYDGVSGVFSLEAPAPGDEAGEEAVSAEEVGGE